MNRNKRIKLIKEFLKLYLPITIISSLVFYYWFDITTNQHRNTVKHEENQFVNYHKTIFENMFTNNFTNAIMLSNVVTLFENDKRELLKKTFKQLANEKRIYAQIRYINKFGDEIIRVDWSDSSSVLVPQNQLQNKSTHVYFKKGISEKGEIYVSKFDLNVEKGEIEKPIKPMIRIAYPVINKKKEIQGLIVLNLLGKVIIDGFNKHGDETNGKLFITNSDGFWLLGPSSSVEWGFMFESRKNEKFQKTYPEEWETISTNEFGQFMTENGLFTFVKMFSPNYLPEVGGKKNRVVFEEAYYIIKFVENSKLNHASWKTEVFVFSTFLFLLIIPLYYIAKINRLRHSERIVFNSLIDNLPSAVFFKDLKGKFTRVNKALLIKHGYKNNSEIIGKTDFDLFDYNNAQKAFNDEQKVIKTRENYRGFRELEEWQDGHKSWSLTSRAPLVEENKVIGTFGISTDITEIVLSEEALRESETKYRELYSNLSIGVYRAKINGEIVFANSAFYTICKANKNVLKNVNQITSDEERETFIQKLKSQKNISGFESTIKDSSGNSIHLLESSRLWFDENGIPNFYEGTIEDITQRVNAEEKINELVDELEERVKERTVELEKAHKDLLTQLDETKLQKNKTDLALTELEKSTIDLKKLSLAIENTPTSVVITNRKGIVEYVNPNFIEESGYSKEETMGNNIRIISSGKHKSDFYKDLWRTITSGKNWKGEFENRKKDGTLYWESGSISPVFNKNGEITNFIAVLEEITKRKKLEQYLKEAKEAAETATQEKSDFLANVSHELRTPLNIINGNNQLLKIKNVNKDLTKMIESIDNSIGQLTKMITDIIEFSTLEDDLIELEINDFSINEIFNSLNHFYSKGVKKKGLQIKYDNDNLIPTVLRGDSKRLLQALRLLVDNAIKFTDSGFVSISTKLVKRNKNNYKVNFLIEDTGVGISPHNMDKLFMSFTQVDGSSTRKFGGIGIGLTLCDKIVNLMGGNITVASELEKGSQFSFIINFEKSYNTEFEDQLTNEQKLDEDLIDSKIDSESLNIKPELSEEEYLIKCNELKELLEKYDSEALNKIKEIISNKEFEKEMREIEKNINIYDFEKALEILNKIHKTF